MVDAAEFGRLRKILRGCMGLPPNNRNQGRKPIKEGQATVSMTIRLTAGQREKLAKLGGAQWVRDKIDKART